MVNVIKWDMGEIIDIFGLFFMYWYDNDELDYEVRGWSWDGVGDWRVVLGCLVGCYGRGGSGMLVVFVWFVFVL